MIDLPQISNFTDFDSPRIEPDVFLRIVRSASDLNQPDAVILPGSKNVIGDLEYLRQSGLSRKIFDLPDQGRTEVVGLCGGFQMLGQRVEDPYGIESAKKTINGLGLMPISTVMAQQKNAQGGARTATPFCTVRRTIAPRTHHAATRRPAPQNVDVFPG